MSLKTLSSGLSECIQFKNAIQLILGRLFFRKTNFVSYRLNELEVLADHAGGDVNSIRACLVGQMYKPYIDYISSKVGPKLSALDLGANAGGFSLMLKNEGFEIERLVAVEMNPLTFSRLQLNLLTNIGPKAKCINAAAACNNENVKITFGRGSTGESMDAINENENRDFTIPSLTINSIINDNFSDKPIDLIKCDIEGSEWPIFEKDECCNKIKDAKFLLIEVHPIANRSIQDFEVNTARLGFQKIELSKSSDLDLFLFENQK
ncbi:MAG: FkbM family methyltransferase [Opitutales bacterium]|nr:FkbM family methyltransferase [Opitutales bacterium]